MSDTCCEALEWVVVNEDGSEPSSVCGSWKSAQECCRRREEVWPEDGPQRIVVQMVMRSEWISL